MTSPTRPWNWGDLRTDKIVVVSTPIHLNKSNTHIRVDRSRSGLKEETIFSRVQIIQPMTNGTVLDYTNDEILVQFRSGVDWSTFAIWIKRTVSGQWLNLNP